MKECAADGFMLDYECAPPLCYDERCRQAFGRYTGLADVAWPGDVKKGGRYYQRWVEFRCEQGARYVKVIGEAARRARPGCALQAWVAGYNYANTLETAQIYIDGQLMTAQDVHGRRNDTIAPVADGVLDEDTAKVALLAGDNVCLNPTQLVPQLTSGLVTAAADDKANPTLADRSLRVRLARVYPPEQ